MSKIVKNNTGGNISVSDTGITVNASSQYTIPPQDYLLWAASDNIVTEVGAGNLIISDGSTDLSISDGIDLLKGTLHSAVTLEGATDNTKIGNVGDSLKVTSENEITVNISNQNTDLFDRISVAQDYPIWSYSHNFDTDESLYWDTSISNTGTIVVDTTKKQQILTNSLTNTDTVTTRTFRYFQYSKGRMQTFMMTIQPNGGQTNVVKNFGAFDDKNGLMFRLNGTSPELIIRSNTSGSVVETVIPQSSWTDKLDGTGSSGITYNFDKYQLFYISYAWLGGNAVEWGIFDDGKRIPIYKKSFMNVGTVPYSQSGNLPICLDITNQASVGTAPKLESTCFAVFNNGVQEELGEVFSVDTGASEITVNTTKTIIASIRMQSNKNRAGVKPLSFSLLSPSGNSTIFYEIQIGCTFTGDSWSSISNSICEGLDSYTTYTPGFTIQSGYIRAGGENVIVAEILSNLYLGRTLDGTSQALTITARTISSNAKLLFSGSYREYK